MNVQQMLGQVTFSGALNTSAKLLHTGTIRIPATIASCVGTMLIAEAALRGLSYSLKSIPGADPKGLSDRAVKLVSDKIGVNLQPYASSNDEAWKLAAKGVVACLAASALWDLGRVVFGQAPKGLYDTMLSLTPFNAKNEWILPNAAKKIGLNFI